MNFGATFKEMAHSSWDILQLLQLKSWLPNVLWIANFLVLLVFFVHELFTCLNNFSPWMHTQLPKHLGNLLLSLGVMHTIFNYGRTQHPFPNNELLKGRNVCTSPVNFWCVGFICSVVHSCSLTVNSWITDLTIACTKGADAFLVPFEQPLSQ